ncbi:RNA polymerase sigma-70 factor, ECF subfamily [Sphingobacterium nematocida]|uniref:RNA polymerase sigma factor n=1 Tax=Sphingobacterium nematocida TaxID=1513896 RepID=A0A1T5ATA6_9SPHI|nr:sigma-70 family RNA polymerase sigma factor [Sphingobacterium nematocida]SKB38244.1 RNA polymerase sigma-70 factor, ECF subfamily [Sphingobacterium nematocida]
MLENKLGCNEKMLIKKMQNGDPLAFEKLYFKYSSYITSHLLFLLKSSEWAQEVLQDTFMTVWEQRCNIDIEKSFKSYLLKIATNKTYKLFRKAAYDHAYRTQMLDLLEKGHSPIESYIYTKENELLVQNLLNKMPDRQREVFILFKLEGYSYKEISKRIGISQSTVNTHINRSNQFIKSQLLANSEYFPLILFFFFHLPN